MFKVAERETSVMKLVKQETMQVFDVVRIERRLSAKDDSLRQVITWNENRKTIRYMSSCQMEKLSTGDLSRRKLGAKVEA